MDNFVFGEDDDMCRICFKKQDTVYSLFRKQKGKSPSDKLNKIGVKADVNDTGPSCICCDCLAQLETTVQFLAKCQKSNGILGEHMDDACKDSDALNFESEIVDGNKEECENTVTQESKSDEQLGVEEASCGECGSRRRCQHWAPPTTHTCPKCDKVFARKFNLKLHLKRHSSEREWWCAECGASAVSRWLAGRHCSPRARRPCPVPGCDKTYTSSTNLSVHMRSHNGEKPFECNDCGKKFSSKNTLLIHIRIHTGALPYICPICGKQFRTNKLSSHMLTHSGVPFGCSKQGCGKRFASRAALQRHARSHTAAAGRAPPEHACVLCSSSYYHKQSLNKHMKKVHAQPPVRAARVELPETKTKIRLRSSVKTKA